MVNTPHRLVVEVHDIGVRLDLFLAAHVASHTRSQLKLYIETGHVTVNAQPVKPGRKLRLGDEVVFIPPAPTPSRLVPEPRMLNIVYEDRYLIVVDKSAGWVVHPAHGHKAGTLVHALLAHCRDLVGIGGELRPGIVHRLDKDTSGLLVVAKDEATLNALAAQFKAKNIARTYNALVAPPPVDDTSTIRTLYGRHPRDRKRFTSRVRQGKPAVTHYRVLKRFGTRAALIECHLETGRTHQIRVHCREYGFPVLGDPVYGRLPQDPQLRAVAKILGRQALHAVELSLRHPHTGEWMIFRSPLPADMQVAIETLRS